MIHVRGPEALRARARRQAARVMADRFLGALIAATDGKSPDFVIEVCRACIRTLSRVIEDRGDATRARGVLAGAEADLAPAWIGASKATRADADALFAEPCE